MICDTCGKESPVVSRVVIDKGYNRANAQPVYNCPDCFERKNRERTVASPEDPAVEPARNDGAAPSSPATEPSS